MFIGRERELGTLEDKYASGKFEFVGLYGRRRVGKTALLGEFAKDKPCIFFTAIEDDPQANLRLLSQAIFLLDNPDSDPALAPVYGDYVAAVDAVFALAQRRRVILVIDEFPYVARTYPAFPSILQAAIDRNKDDSRLFLILCGSSLSFMREQLMGKQSPLYGRKTGQIELRPFDFFESRRFFPGASFETSLALYSMVGGIPLYLQQLDPSKSMEENVAAAFLDASSILYDEPANLLKQEVSKAATYNAVISAVAGGSSQHNEIATQAGIESAALDYYLKELVRLDLLEKELPITPGGRGTWRITDHLFRFWYRYVRSRQPMVERGLGARAAAWIVDALPEYVGFVFEEACRVWLWRAYAGGPPRRGGHRHWALVGKRPRGEGAGGNRRRRRARRPRRPRRRMQVAQRGDGGRRAFGP